MVNGVIVDLLLNWLAWVWQSFARLTLVLGLRILALAGWKWCPRCWHGLVGEELTRVVVRLPHLVAQHFTRITHNCQTILGALANHRDPSSRILECGILWSYEALNDVA